MAFEARIPEGGKLDPACERLFVKAARWGGRPAADRIYRILGDAIKPGMTVLDIGTGPAAIPMHLKKRFPGTCFMGLDVSQGMLQQAAGAMPRRDRPVRLLCADGESLPFCGGSVDAVLCFFALHHMDRPERLLAEVDRVLKPGGTFLLIDFRRDVSPRRFRLFNLLWNAAFFFTAGRSGFQDSVRSAWSPEEIINRLAAAGIHRFRLHTNPVELWIMAGIDGGSHVQG